MVDRWLGLAARPRGHRRTLARALSMGSLLACASLGCGSTSTPAGLEVIVQTDLSTSQYASLWVQVQQQTSTGTFRSLVNEPLGTSLPARFAIAPGSSPDQDVLIVVTAYVGAASADGGPGTPVVVRTEQAQVPTTYLAELDIELSASQASCAGGTFVAGTATTPTTCTINTTDAGPLPTFHPGDLGFDAGVTPSDAATDGKVRGDGGRDARTDAARDGGPDATLDSSGAPDATAEASMKEGGAGCVTNGASCGGVGSGMICTMGMCALGCEIQGAYFTPQAPELDNPCMTCQPLVSTSGFTPVAATTSCGNGQLCNASGSCGSACVIDGVSVPPNTVDPADACQSCQPGTSTTGWSKDLDGTSCGNDEVCSGGICSSGCFILGTFYAADAGNVADTCQDCQPSMNTMGWSTSAPNGAGCGMGEVCNAGSCVPDCFIGQVLYDAGDKEPMNPCQSCQPSFSTTGWSPNAGANGQSCGTAELCNAGSCASGCIIAGTFYAASVPNPNNTCQSCQPSASTMGWTSVSGSPACGGGQTCTMGQCGSGCVIGTSDYASGQVNPANACQACEPGVSMMAWTDDADGTGCGPGSVCKGGTCGPGCVIDGVVYPPATQDPANACQSCQPTMSTTGWTPTPSVNGMTCAPGEVCSGASCVAECYIASNFYLPNSADEANVCESCQPATSTAMFSANPSANGTACGTSMVCNAGTCSSGCYIGGAFYAPSALNPMNACQLCQPSTSATAWSNAGTGVSCGNGQICNGGSCGPGCIIGGASYAPGAPNPANSCQSCQPGLTTGAWSNSTVGSSCGTGMVCNASDVCSADCYIDGTIYTSGEANPASACQVCVPSSSTTSWQAASPGASCGMMGACSAGSCSTTFAYTGGPQSFTVPAGITSVTVLATGASSGGGIGASFKAVLPVTSGSTLGVYVGGEGTTAQGGYNGGGAGGFGMSAPGVGGAGSSDVRMGTTPLIVAGGGGGGPFGGAGGQPNGGAGESSAGDDTGGGGGSSMAGGMGGVAFGAMASAGAAGAFEMGGAGGNVTKNAGIGGGGGGGGYFGGGGGGGDSTGASRGGGGGSSYVISGASQVLFMNVMGTSAQNGSITISY